MGNLAERLKTVNKNRPIVLVDELASTGELMIRLSREVLKHLEKDADITLATLLLLDAVSDLYGVKHGGTMAPSQNKLHTHMDTFVPRVSFERLQQSLEAKATQLGFKKPSGLMKKLDALKDEFAMPSKREFHDQGDYSSRSHLSKAYQARQGTPTQDSTQRKSRDDTLSYADDDQLADHDEEPSTNKGPTHDYDTPQESTHKLIEDFRNPSKQASSKGSQPSNILGALTMARSRSRNPNQTSQREDRSTPSLQASDRRADWNKENQSSHNYYERSLNLKDVRLSNDSFGMEKPFRTNEYQTEEDNEAYQSTSPARPFFRGPSHKDEASEYDSGSVMPGDCWQRSRASANTRGPARDQSGFYSHMSEAESRSMEWEDDYE